MTSPDMSPELGALLRSSRPAAPSELRAHVRELSARQPATSSWPRLRLPSRRAALVVLPAAAALALASAGVLGLARSDGTTEAVPERTEQLAGTAESGKGVPGALVPSTQLGAQDSAATAAGDRAQRVSATLTVEVADPDAVSRAAQEALDLTSTLGGHVVTSSVATGDEGSASITVRVPVARVQEAIVGLSGLGRIVSQQVSIQDLQADLDRMERRERSVREQIARISARLESGSLDDETRAVLEARRRALRSELSQLRQGISSTNAEASMATIQLTVVTSDSLGGVAVPSRLDRTLDEALNVLVWEGVVALAVLIVAAPFALVFGAAWLGHRLYRRREDDRLLAT
jgi:Domain of unknown function (DUF4349)